jgi:hypothetical protein
MNKLDNMNNLELNGGLFNGLSLCKNCRGYYKLQPGESPDDFTDNCACGGELRYAINIDVVGENKTFSNKNESKLDKQYNKSGYTTSKTTNNSEKHETKHKQEFNNNHYTKPQGPSKEKKSKTDNPDTSWADATNRKGIFFIGFIIIIFGFTNGILLWVGIATWIIGVLLFLTDSWIAYLLIYVLWALGGIVAFLDGFVSQILGAIFSVIIALFGIGYIIVLAKERGKNKKIKGHIDI